MRRHQMIAGRALGSRGCFTLLELMLVLGILVALVAFAAPSFQGMLESSRLEGGAEQLRTLLRQARREAINKGVPYRVDVVLETGSMRLVPAEDPLEEDGGDLAENVEDFAGGVSGEGLREPRPLRMSEELPVGVRVLPSNELQRLADEEESDMETMPGTENSKGASPTTTGADAAFEKVDFAEASSATSSSNAWSPWFEFFPDGSATESKLVVVNAHKRFVEVRVEDLTGAVTVSPVYGPDDVDEEGRIAEPAREKESSTEPLR